MPTYNQLVRQLVQSVIENPSEHSSWYTKCHSYIIRSKAEENIGSELSAGSLLYEKIFRVSQAGNATVFSKLEQEYVNLKKQPQHQWEEALKLLCLLSEDIPPTSSSLRTIGEDCGENRTPLKLINGPDPAYQSSCQDVGLFIPPVYGCGSIPYEEPNPMKCGRSLDCRDFIDPSLKLAEMFPGKGVNRAFSNDDVCSLFGAMCLPPPPFSSILQGRFVLGLPELPQIPRTLATTASTISSSSTIITLEDEGYSSRPTTPGVKKVVNTADWEAALDSEKRDKRRIQRKVNPYSLRLMRNQVDVYIDDTLFSRCAAALLQGLQSEVFDFDEENKTFRFPPRASLYGVRLVIFQGFCRSLVSVGNLVREVNLSLQSANPVSGGVKEAFYISLRKQSDEILSQIPDFSSTKSLITFVEFAMRVRDSFKLFCYLAEQARSRECSGLHLLSEIAQITDLLTTNEHLKAGLELLVASCGPLMRIVGAWLYGKADHLHPDMIIPPSFDLDPVVDLSILDEIRKVGEQVALLRSVSLVSDVSQRNRDVPDLLLATSGAGLDDIEISVMAFLEKHKDIFEVRLNLEESWSDELEQRARETRMAFFEKALEQKRQNEEELKKRKLKDFEERRKAMNEELERKKAVKDEYMRYGWYDTRDTDVATDNAIDDNGNTEAGKNVSESLTANENPVVIVEDSTSNGLGDHIASDVTSLCDNLITRVDNANEVNANYENENNVFVRVAITDIVKAKNVLGLPLDCAADVSPQHSFVSFYEADNSDAMFLSVNESEVSQHSAPEEVATTKDNDTPCNTIVESVANDVVEKEMQKRLESLAQCCSKKLTLYPGGLGDVAVVPYSLPVVSTVLGLKSGSEPKINVEEYRNVFINSSDMVERSLIPHLNAQSKLVNRALLNAVISEHRLDEHIRGLRRFFLLHDGEFAAALSGVINDVGLLSSTSGILTLSSSLKHTLAQSIYSDTLAARHLTLKVHRDGLSVELGYNTPWPIDLVLTEEMMKKYVKVNRLLIDLRCKSSVMDRGLWKIFKAGRNGKDTEKLAVVTSSVREACHVLNAIRRYFHCQAIEIGWSSLKNDWKRVQTLEDVFQAHAKYIDGVLNRCLLLESASTIKKVVDQVTAACINVVQSALDYIESQKQNELKFMESFRKFREATKVLCIVVKCAASRHQSSYLAMFDLEVDFNNFFKSLKV